MRISDWSSDVCSSDLIRQAQELGFSLREVCELLDLRTDPPADAADVRARATAKLSDVNEKMRQPQRIRDALETLIAACPGRGPLGDRKSVAEGKSVSVGVEHGGGR